MSDLGYRGDCPFCERIKDSAYEGEGWDSVSFTPLNPVTPGHLLVVPRKHVEHALEVPAVTADAMHFAAALGQGLGIESCNLITSVGGWASQTVKHLHIHIVPRRPGDGLLLPWGQVEKCGYCYCRLDEAPECADGCAHRDLQGYVGCFTGGAA